MNDYTQYAGKPKKLIGIGLILSLIAICIWAQVAGASTLVDPPKTDSDTIQDRGPVTFDRPLMVLQFYDGEWYQFDFDYEHQLTEWESYAELRAFLAYDETDSTRYWVTGEPAEDCDDFAYRLRDNAAIVGKNLEVIVINATEYNKWYPLLGYPRTNDPEHYHALNMARIGNKLWFIEPLTDEAWHALNVD